ncbi:MAG: hypothetical protein LBG24_07055, partial [Treponema sp.]|nr:hypothetical protein [Treponema sp.]
MDSRTISENRGTAMLPLLVEKQRRLFLALEAHSIERGGVKLIHELSCRSHTTILRGNQELESGRKSGGGRKGIT